MSVKLNLRNFKKYKQLELDLPRTGLIRLHGASGTGKTSILQAITYALYGKCSGSVNTWNEKTSRVELEAFGLNIARTRGPNEVTVNGMVFSDDADNLIASTLNMSRLEFDLSSYVKQQSENSILALSPAEQLNVIHQLAFKGKSPNEVKEKLKKSLNDTIAELQNTEAGIESIQASIRDTEEQISFEEGRASKPSTVPEEVKITSLKANSKLQSLQLKLSGLTKEQSRLKAIQSGEIYGKIKRCYAFIERFPSELELKEKWLNSNPPPENEQYLSDRYNDALDKKKAAIHEKTNIAQSIELLKDKVKYERARFQIANEFKNAHQRINPTDIDSISKQDLVSLANSSQSFSRYLNIVTPDSDMTALKESFEEKSREAEEAVAEVEELESVRKQNIERDSNIRRVKKEIAELHSHLKIAQDLIHKYKDIPSESGLYAQIEAISNEKVDVQNVINTVSTVISDCKAEMVKHEQYLASMERIRILGKRVVELNGEISRKLIHVNGLRAKIENINTLIELSVKTGLEVVSKVLDEINIRAKYWLDQLFDGEVSAVLVPYKKLKSKEEVVDKISLEVLFNGTKLSDYNDDLSGGQKVRLRTAFSLAMSDMFNSPILILDESFSGVDNATVLDCLEAIHPLAQRKLVLVVEHGASGYQFDRTIEVG